MPLVTTGELVAAATAAGSAVAAFNVVTLEHVEAVVTGAESADTPVVLKSARTPSSSGWDDCNPSPVPPSPPPNAPPYPSRCTSTTSRATPCCDRPRTPGSAP